jgi:hypothetical protein
MTSGAIHNAVNRPVTPALIKVAGMAGDLYGGPDGRSALVLLNGLTYAGPGSRSSAISARLTGITPSTPLPPRGGPAHWLALLVLRLARGASETPARWPGSAARCGVT